MTAIGIDLGGTKIMAALVDDGQVVGKAKKATPRVGGPDDVLDAIAAAIAKVDPDETATSIGVGVPGPVRPGSGVLPVASNLPGWTRDVDVAAGLRERCGDRPIAVDDIVVDNDVNVGTLAEHRLGAGRGVDNLIGVFMGTGVGAGVVLDGRLRRGPRGLAGELGHTYVSFREFADSSIGRGELEDYAGRRMMEARARARHRAGEETALVDLVGERRMKSSTWQKAREMADPMTLSILDEAADALAAALAGAIALVDIEVVVLGGGMAARLGESFRADLESRLDDRVFAGTTAPVRAAALGDMAGAIGASLLVEDAT
jgi:glucokinase